jgi:hypothetical protein
MLHAHSHTNTHTHTVCVVMMGSALFATWFTLSRTLGCIRVQDETSVRQGSGTLCVLFPVDSLGTFAPSSHRLDYRRSLL